MTWSEIHQFDQQLTLAINSWHSTLTDPVWAFFSKIPVWIPMYAAIVALLIWRLGWKKGLIMTLAAVATFGFCDQFSNLIKDLVCRARPLHDDFMLSNGLHILEQGGRSFSFFSAHAANAFGLSVSTLTGLKIDKEWFPEKGKANICGRLYAIWMLFWAVMVSLSRVFVGRHYLGDVIVGAITGALAGFAFASLARLVIRRYFA